MRSARALVALAALMAGPATAGGLMDRTVTFGALAYDDPDAPIYVGVRHPAQVGPGIEYGLGPEGPQNGWDIVPSIIDIQDQAIVLTYPEGVSGEFPEPEFNGYVLDFLTECVLFNGASQDMENSTVTLDADAIFTDGSRLFVDVGGISFGPDVYVVVNVDVADCPLS